MKRCIILLISIFVSSISVLAQQPTVRTNEEAATFFSKASIMDSTMFLVCNEKFAMADKAKQEEIIIYMLTLSSSSRAIVECNGKCWLWLLYDNRLHCTSWNTNQNLIDEYNYAQIDRLGEDKWFFTIGGNLSLSSSMDVSLGLNGRVGTYLWKRYLDTGLGLNVRYSNYGGKNNCDISIDLSSRLYFSRFFSKCPFAPFVGVGIGGVFCPDAKFNVLGSAGFNWYLQKGSIDFSVQYGNASKLGVSVGYTTTF